MRLSFACLAIWVAIAMNCWIMSHGFCQDQLPPARDNPEQVFVQGDWKTPEQLAIENESNSALNEYVSIRQQMADTFEGQYQLARWCDTRNLIEQRGAHLKRALSFNPESVAIRNLLGHVNVNGIWLTAEQIDEQRKLAAEANKRFADWQKPVSEIAGYLISESRKRQEIGLDRLFEIVDPRSVTALEAILVPANEAVAQKTVEVIGRFPEREATESLVRISIFSPWKSVRGQSLELLAERNRYDFVPALMNQLLTPFSARRSITTDASGNVLYQYALFQRDMDSEAVRQFESVLLQNPMSDQDIQPNLALNANRRALQADAIVQQLNSTIETRNRAIQTILGSTTGVDPGDSPDDWWRWWYDENEVTLYERPVSYTRVRNAEMTVPYMRAPQQQRVPRQDAIQTGGMRGECLVAGTPVWTERGPRAVETLMIGDRVLCQDTDSQKLEFRAVLQPTVRPPTATWQISLDGEVVQASGGHLFWVHEKGWTKVRDLEPGMSLSSAGGPPVEINGIEPGETVELYNLIVDRRANYFVGTNRILSHDSTILAQGEKSVEQAARK